jgi:hypothetical protein
LRAFRRPSLIKVLLNQRRTNNVPAICIRVDCQLEEYKLLLREMAGAARFSLMWTNIYQPSIVMQGHTAHRAAFRTSRVTNKKQVSFVRQSEVVKWKQDAALSEFQATIPPSTSDEKRCFYVLENVHLHHPDVVIGDYAIFDEAVMLSFNPKTEDLNNGDLFIILGDVAAHLKVFKLVEAGSDLFATDVQALI